MDAFRSNLHTHSIFSDGIHTAEEMVITAIGLGFESIGFSEHSPVPYENPSALKAERLEEYALEIQRLKAKYHEEIEIYHGIEVEALYPISKSGFDYTIGSVHDLFCEETKTHYAIDHTPELLQKAITHIAGGDTRIFVERYYQMVIEMLMSYRPDIVGHIDLIIKLNEGNRFFDESALWYKKLQEYVVDKVAESGCIVEVNTGGIFRGYRDIPYPLEYMLSLMHERAVPITISADAHSKESLNFYFEEALAMARQVGYDSIVQMKNGIFTEVGL